MEERWPRVGDSLRVDHRWERIEDIRTGTARPCLRGAVQGGLNIKHASPFVAFVEELLERHAIGFLVERRLKLEPCTAQFRGTLGIGECGRVEQGSFDTPNDLTQGDFGRGTGEQVTSLLAAETSDNLVRFQLDQDLNQISGSQSVFTGEFLDARRSGQVMPSCQAQHGTRCVITFCGQFHAER